jgi:hypothetical protein
MQDSMVKETIKIQLLPIAVYGFWVYVILDPGQDQCYVYKLPEVGAPNPYQVSMGDIQPQFSPQLPLRPANLHIIPFHLILYQTEKSVLDRSLDVTGSGHFV